MGAFGKFTVNVPTTFSFGNLTLELPAGEYEPKDAEEVDALLHLASMSFAPTGADKSTAYAEQTQAPDAATAIPAESAPAPEAPLPEPPEVP